MRHAHFPSDRMQMAVKKRAQLAAKVAAILTTPLTRQSRDRAQVVDKTHAPVAQPG